MRVRQLLRYIPGAVYLHQGESYVVDSLDFDEGLAFVHSEDPGYATFARELTDIAVTGAGERQAFGSVTLGLVPVRVTNRIVGYLRRRLTGEVIDFVELDMPPHTLDTTAVMYTITPEALHRNGIDPLQIPGSLHAAEHAAIGLLPLVASCDRGDIGGLSTAVGPEFDGLPSVFVYDGYPGGAGFAEQGFRQASIWLGATMAAIEACECPSGCPSCVQSPKCGNGNDPLDKAGAVRVLRLVLPRWLIRARHTDDDRPLERSTSIWLRRAAAAMKALSSLLKKGAHAGNTTSAKNGWTTQAVHNPQWAQQQNTRRPVMCASHRRACQGRPAGLVSVESRAD